MNEYITEQEQIQQLKNWIKQYGLTVIAGIALALAGTSGWRYWQNYQNSIRVQASIIYDTMLTERTKGNAVAVQNHANKLMKDYAKTPYAQMAALELARQAVVTKTYPVAITQLNWVIAHSSSASVQEIAKLRIARILIEEKKPQEAINLLKNINDKNFAALINEVKGDAYLAMNNPELAKKTYAQALQELPNANVTRPVLQMKYDNLTT